MTGLAEIRYNITLLRNSVDEKASVLTQVRSSRKKLQNEKQALVELLMAVQRDLDEVIFSMILGTGEIAWYAQQTFSKCLVDIINRNKN